MYYRSIIWLDSYRNMLEFTGSTPVEYQWIIDESNHSCITFLGNMAHEGGAIKVSSGAVFFKVDANFTNNRALHGGAIFLKGSLESSLILLPAILKSPLFRIMQK